MSEKYRYRINGDGSSVLPITGGTDVFYTKAVQGGLCSSVFSVALFSDSTGVTPASATDGTITFSIIDDGLESVVTGGVINAPHLISAEHPSCFCDYEQAKITFTGVDSGLYARAWVSRDED